MDTDNPFGEGFSAALEDMRGLLAGLTGEFTDATEAMKAMDAQSRSLSRSLSSSLRSAFDRAVFGGEKLSSVFRDLASRVAGRALDAALNPVSNAVASGFSGLLGSLTGAVAGAFADGAAFSSGRVRAFARGGVVDGPTLFPMRGGTGLMGEAGPEAIMPLTRGPDGRLGVAAQGGGATPIVINIQTPDIGGFERSRGQVSAQLARAVRRGQRGL